VFSRFLLQHLAAPTVGDIKLIALSTLEATMESITSAGLATVAEAEAARADLAAFIADPHTLAGDPRIFSVWAHRPAGHGRPSGNRSFSGR